MLVNWPKASQTSQDANPSPGHFQVFWIQRKEGFTLLVVGRKGDRSCLRIALKPGTWDSSPSDGAGPVDRRGEVTGKLEQQGGKMGVLACSCLFKGRVGSWVKRDQSDLVLWGMQPDRCQTKLECALGVQLANYQADRSSNQPWGDIATGGTPAPLFQALKAKAERGKNDLTKVT